MGENWIQHEIWWCLQNELIKILRVFYWLTQLALTWLMRHFASFGILGNCSFSQSIPHSRALYLHFLLCGCDSFGYILCHNNLGKKVLNTPKYENGPIFIIYGSLGWPDKEAMWSMYLFGPKCPKLFRNYSTIKADFEKDSIQIWTFLYTFGTYFHTFWFEGSGHTGKFLCSNAHDVCTTFCMIQLFGIICFLVQAKSLKLFRICHKGILF